MTIAGENGGERILNFSSLWMTLYVVEVILLSLFILICSYYVVEYEQNALLRLQAVPLKQDQQYDKSLESNGEQEKANWTEKKGYQKSNIYKREDTWKETDETTHR